MRIEKAVPPPPHPVLNYIVLLMDCLRTICLSYFHLCVFLAPSHYVHPKAAYLATWSLLYLVYIQAANFKMCKQKLGVVHPAVCLSCRPSRETGVNHLGWEKGGWDRGRAGRGWG